MTDKAIRRVAVYYRVSSEQQAEGDTIQSQKLELPKWCKEKGWKAVAEYEDDGLSAKTTDRPEFQKLLLDIEEGTYDAVVVRDFSRLSRDFGDAVSVLSPVLRKGNCAVASEGDGSIIFPSSGIMDYMLYGLKAYASEEENKRRSKAVKSGLAKAKANNNHGGGGIPFGIRWIDRRFDENGREIPVKRWAKNEQEATTLLYASELLRSGMSTEAVAQKLNENLDKYPTKQMPSTQRKVTILKEKLKAEPANPKLRAKLEKTVTRLKSLKWSGAQIWSLFQSDHLFTGKNKDKSIDYGIKLLTKKEVMEIRDKLSRKRRSGARRKKLGRRYNFLLRRIVECEECGWHLAIQDVNRRSKYYRCKKCGVGFRAIDLDLSALNLLIGLPKNLRASIAKENFVSDVSLAELESMRLKLEGKIGEIQAQINRTGVLVADGLMTREVALEYKAKKDKEADGVKAELQKVLNTLEKATTESDLEKVNRVARGALKEIVGSAKDLKDLLQKLPPNFKVVRNEVFHEGNGKHYEALRNQIREALISLTRGDKNRLVARKKNKEGEVTLISNVSAIPLTNSKTASFG